MADRVASEIKKCLADNCMAASVATKEEARDEWKTAEKQGETAEVHAGRMGQKDTVNRKTKRSSAALDPEEPEAPKSTTTWKKPRTGILMDSKQHTAAAAETKNSEEREKAGGAYESKSLVLEATTLVRNACPPDVVREASVVRTTAEDACNEKATKDQQQQQQREYERLRKAKQREKSKRNKPEVPNHETTSSNALRTNLKRLPKE